LGWLEEQDKGYQFSEKQEDNTVTRVSSASFADDQALVSGNCKDVQELLDTAVQFYNYNELQLNVSSTTKTAYMTNSKGNDKVFYKERNGLGTITTKEIPRLDEKGAYPYLGVWLAIDGTWTKQQQVLHYTISEFMKYLEGRAFTAFQKVTAVNRILIPAIEYRLQAAAIEKTTLEGWNKLIAFTLVKRMGWYWKEGKKMVHLPRELGGLGLLDVLETNVIAKVSSVISLTYHGTDPETIHTLESLSLVQTKKGKKTDLERMNGLLKKCKLKVRKSETDFTMVSLDNIQGFTNPASYGTLKAIGKTKISDFIRPNGKVVPYKCFLEKHKLNRLETSSFISPQAYYPAIKYLENKKLDETKQKQRANLLLTLSGKKIRKEDCLEEHDGFRAIFTDGSYDPKTGKSGSGVCTNITEFKTIAGRTPYNDGSYGAELYAVWLALEGTEPDFNIRIYADNLAEVNLLNSYWNGYVKTDERKRRKDPLTPLIDAISRLRSDRLRSHGSKVEIAHVYSHLLDNVVGERTPEDERRISEMQHKYGPEGWKILARGNQIADIVAKEALQHPRPLTKSLKSNSLRMEIVDGDAEYQTGLRKIIGRKFSELKKRAALSLLENRLGMKVGPGNLPALRIQNCEIAKEQEMILKLLWTELRTKDRQHERIKRWEEYRKKIEEDGTDFQKKKQEEKSSLFEKLKKAYETNKCPFGCQEIETPQHFHQCPRNPTPKLSEITTQALRKYDEKGNWDEKTNWNGPTQNPTTQTAPAPLHPQPSTRQPSQQVEAAKERPNEEKRADKLQQVSVAAKTAGLIPKNLHKMVQIEPESLTNLNGREKAKIIQIEILAGIRERWRIRCKEAFKATTQSAPRQRKETRGKRTNPRKRKAQKTGEGEDRPTKRNRLSRRIQEEYGRIGRMKRRLDLERDQAQHASKRRKERDK
jgi:hypothetical protein